MPLFQRKTLVMMVCTENLCRSPIAEGLLRYHVQRSGLGDRVKAISAGTRASQAGCKPDQRAQKVVANAGIKLGRIRARRVAVEDFNRCDYILAMDKANLRDLTELCPAQHRHKISLLMSHLRAGDLEVSDEVPDPYYGSFEGFQSVFALIDSAVADFVAQIAGQPR